MDREEEKNLPVVRFDDLPVPLPDLGPQHEIAAARFPKWMNWASQRHVRDVAYSPQTDELWLATAGGVLRWYAKQQKFTRYYSEHGLPGNSILAIEVDGLGSPWCAPEHGGLYRLRDEQWIKSRVNGLQSLPIRCLAMDRDGQIWTGTKEAIYEINLDGTISRQFNFPSVEPPRAITVSDKDNAWVCSTQGLFRFSDEQDIHRVGKQPSLLALACFGSSLWVGKVDGLVYIDLETGMASQKAEWPTGAVTALLPFAEGVLVAKDTTLGWVSEGGWRPLLKLDSHISAIERDGADGAWVATHQDLVHWCETDPVSYLDTRTPPDRIKLLETDVHLPNLIQSLGLERSAGSSVLWAGTPKGLFQYDPSGYAPQAWKYRPVDGVQDVRAVSTGFEAGELLLSSWSGGVTRYQRTGSVEAMMGIEAPILSLSEGIGNTHWAVGTDGLYRSEMEKWQLTFRNSRLPFGAKLRTVVATQKNHLWLGTSAGLLLYLLEDDALETPIQNPFSYPVTALAYDSSGSMLWAGTDVGLFGLRPKGDGWEVVKEQKYTVADSGLAANRIVSLALDLSDLGQTILWMGTACGLSRFEYAT